jgi:hypothetical protein
MKPSMSSMALRVVALGGGAGLPAMMRGIAEAFFASGRDFHFHSPERPEPFARASRGR